VDIRKKLYGSVCDSSLQRRTAAALFVAAVGLLAPPVRAADGQFIVHNTPGYVAQAKNLGAASGSQIIDVSIWLQPHNRSELDALVRDLYDPGSAAYRRWLKGSEIAARFAPTAAEAKIVQDLLTSNNLAIVRVGPDNFYVRARGSVADVEKTFRVKLNNYQVGTAVLRANAADPYIEGPAAALTQTVSGLDSGEFEHPLSTASAVMAPPPGASLADAAAPPKVSAAADPSPFDTVCFPGPETVTFSSSLNYPTATYQGNAYAKGSFGCGYSPSNVQQAYGLNALYEEGFDGAGQTIVIIDWCDSPTILADANAFSRRFGLPELTASNFNIINYPTLSACSGVNPEVNVDVEWSHAIAPGANIDLLVPLSGGFEDVDEATYYAATSGLGNVVSGSFSSPENFVSDAELAKENLISEIAAVGGVATNYASGDAGSYAEGGPFPPSVSVPADLPYATGVGGVSLALKADNSIQFQTGWETFRVFLNDDGILFDPPVSQGGFVGGSGGGASAFFAKPWFQKHLSGSYRQLPDVSWLADPLTGGVIAISQPGQLPLQIWYTIGGTSLSTPMFSALWAIANQEAGVPLGQAAPYLYSMPPNTITDIVPFSSAHNATAVIEESASVVHRYDAAETIEIDPQLFGPFYSAIWIPDNGAELVVSFGGNYDLKTAVGWDPVTGVGAPNAKAFADWFAPAKSNHSN
jgi:subtilase family serine protease